MASRRASFADPFYPNPSTAFNMEHDPERSVAAVVQDAQERVVGISVYVCPDTPGFTCTVKQRYTDFLVNEIQPDGQVVHLSTLSVDSEKKRKREEDDGAPSKKQRQGSEEQCVEATASGRTESTEDTQANAGAAADVVQGDGAAGSDVSLESTKANAIASVSDEDKATLKGVFGDDTATSILNLYATVIAYPARKARDQPTVSSEPLTEKAKRTEAHLCVRRIFSSKLETLTVPDPDSQSGPGMIISIKAAPPKPASKPDGDGRSGNQQRGRENWSELGGEYLHFTLYKENKDTMEVLSFLASQLKVSTKHFTFAGTKDRRAVTAQRVAVYRMRQERMVALNRIARGWRLGGPWEYCRDGLELGMLSGNQFLLTLREAGIPKQDTAWDVSRRLEHAKQIAVAAARNLSEFGFLNYYGLQRFGSYSIGTHMVGMKMLKGDLKGAVDAILSYDPALFEEQQPFESSEPRKNIPQDDIARAKAIQEFRNGANSGIVLSRLPTRFSAERSLVTHLGKRDRSTGSRPNENDFQGALMLIQKNLRMMYVHAYQSFVWNTVVGKRFELFGVKVMEGDLVVVGEKEHTEGLVNDSNASKSEVDEDGDPIIHPSAMAAAGEDDSAKAAAAFAEDSFVRARPLSKDEAQSGRFTAFDVVLPLPGFDVLYPRNEIGDLYKTFMASEQGGGLDPNSMRRAWREISLPGGYRKMMARPLGNGVEVDVRAYGAVEEQMVETDLEKLQKTDHSDSSAPTVDAHCASIEKDKLAVLLKLNLGSSQYATMALRELTKGGAVGYVPNFSVANR